MNLLERSKLCIAQGALTNSKRPSTFVEGVYPTHLVKGKGCEVWDTEGKKYVDFITGLGSSILGYAHDEVNEAIAERMEFGATLSLGTHEEVELAEAIKGIFPFVDCMKFLKTGTEAAMAAVRIARAKTRKKTIMSDGYHGWSDGFVSLTEPAIGVEGTFWFAKANEYVASDDVAAIIIEPVMTDFSEKRIEYLRELREFCTKQGTLLIFDEIITGWRFPKFSVANYLGIEPDIILLGKAVANGLPLSIVAGKKEIMNCGEYFVSSTFAGETLSIAAARKTLELMRTKYSLTALWEKGGIWLEEFNSIWPEGIKIEGYPTRGRFVGEPLTRALFMQEACEAGILFGPSWFFNFPLAERKDVLSTIRDVIWKVKNNKVTLKGKLPQSPFAEKIRAQNAP